MNTEQRYILLRKGRGVIRCCIKRIVCIISENGQCSVYEQKKQGSAQFQKHTSGYKLSWFKDQIKDPKYFDIFHGTMYNTRFFKRLDDDRMIHSTVDDLPPLVVSKAQYRGFREHLKRN